MMDTDELLNFLRYLTGAKIDREGVPLKEEFQSNYIQADLLYDWLKQATGGNIKEELTDSALFNLRAVIPKDKNGEKCDDHNPPIFIISNIGNLVTILNEEKLSEDWRKDLIDKVNELNFNYVPERVVMASRPDSNETWHDAFFFYI